MLGTCWSWQDQKSDPEHSKVSNSGINWNTDSNTKDIHLSFLILVCSVGVDGLWPLDVDYVQREGRNK